MMLTVSFTLIKRLGKPRNRLSHWWAHRKTTRAIKTDGREVGEKALQVGEKMGRGKETEGDRKREKEKVGNSEQEKHSARLMERVRDTRKREMREIRKSGRK